MEVERDEISGRPTTGHEWDGLKELDTPVPRVARLAYWLTILYAIVSWVLYPAWPTVSDFSRGVLGYSSRVTVLEKLEHAQERRITADAELLKRPLAELAADPDTRTRYEHVASVLARDNCVMCHGRDLKGQPGFPNLRDGHWLWSGDVGEIEATLRYGINSGHEEERSAEMLAFGAQEILTSQEIDAVTEFVLSLTGQEHDPSLAEPGSVLFDENCSGCHGVGGEGGLGTGAPSLTDQAWLYGEDRERIRKSIWDGRKGVMPAWVGRLGDAEIRKLALYVYWRNHE